MIGDASPVADVGALGWGRQRVPRGRLTRLTDDRCGRGRSEGVCDPEGLDRAHVASSDDPVQERRPRVPEPRFESALLTQFSMGRIDPGSRPVSTRPPGGRSSPNRGWSTKEHVLDVHIEDPGPDDELAGRKVCAAARCLETFDSATLVRDGVCDHRLDLRQQRRQDRAKGQAVILRTGASSRSASSFLRAFAKMLPFWTVGSPRGRAISVSSEPWRMN